MVGPRMLVSAVAVILVLPGRRHGDCLAAEPPRREILDRHGHVLAHVPPLHRDAACAPDLYTAALHPRQQLRMTEAPVTLPGPAIAAPAPIRSRLDGGIQTFAQLAVQRGVEGLARTATPPRPFDPQKNPLRLGQVQSGTVRRVLDHSVEFSLGAPGLVGELLLPPPIACADHAAPRMTRAQDRFQPGEHLRLRVLRLPPPGAPQRVLVGLQPQAALVALDPRTRDILALVGGYGQHPGDFDRASQGRRQAGSTWKPLVYAAALLSGRHQIDEEVEDLPRDYAGWHPRNFTGTYQGRITLRQALAHSVNTVAVRLLADVGPEVVAGLAGRLGIAAQGVPRDLTQALGTAEVSPLQLAGAYAVFADTLAGRYLPPRLFDEDPALPQAGQAALPPAISYLVSSLLHSVVTEGSASRAQALRLPHLYGKTGTTTFGHDAWFVGYHRDLLAVVWVGDDAADGGGRKDDGQERSGADTALPLWMDFLRLCSAVTPGSGQKPLPCPPGVSETREGGPLTLIR